MHGFVKYITSPAGKQLKETLREVLYEGNLYDYFDGLLNDQMNGSDQDMFESYEETMGRVLQNIEGEDV